MIDPIDPIDLVDSKYVHYFQNIEDIEVDQEKIILQKLYTCFNGFIYHNTTYFQIHFNPITFTLHYVVLSYDNKKKLEKKHFFDNLALLYSSTNPFTTMFIGLRLAELKNYSLNKSINYPFSYINQWYPHKEQYIPMMLKQALEDYENFDINTIEL